MVSLNDIQIAAVTALRNYKAGPESQKTTNLRTVAEAFFDAREHFFTPEGTPDWKGRTHAYRVWVRETMRTADIQKGELTTVQAAIRYHVGNVVRERMDDGALMDLGLSKSSPRERSVEKRGRNSEILAIFGAGGAEIATPEEVLLTVRSIGVALARISQAELAGMGARRREEIRESLETVQERVNELVAVASSRRK
jgi:hypothetical protein